MMTSWTERMKLKCFAALEKCVRSWANGRPGRRRDERERERERVPAHRKEGGKRGREGEQARPQHILCPMVLLKKKTICGSSFVA